jgi:predicted dehydrogenase/threonine dehydrogenase-like Zn-dependent dehydrogenase
MKEIGPDFPHQNGGIMNQLTQQLKKGELKVVEVPPPLLLPGMVLVRNHFSLISPGTESHTVETARMSLVGKAKKRPEQVRQVLTVLRQQGPVQTYRAVMKRLEAYAPLGYSTAGEVLDMAPHVEGFRVGDHVACGGGGYAVHAEIVAVPANLCVKLAAGADLSKAAYNTLGAIALQGIRQADLSIGETCAVIGLGLIGQLTCLMLRANGVKTIGIDIDSRMVDIARRNCADNAFGRGESGLEEKIAELTDGIGVDSVIIAAATESVDPVNFAGRIARKKGKVVVVGDAPTGFTRESYYQKELELRMSCSYGPGRYDPEYEEKGHDYPAGYVRWTENRNMRAFQDLITAGKINIDFLTTRVFGLDEAPKAYDLILERKEPVLGILIKYDVGAPEIKRKIVTGKQAADGKVKIAFVGAGNYAQSYLIPNLPKSRDVVLKAILDAIGTTSKKAAEKFGFEFCTSDEADIFGNPEINTVFIGTRHDSHAAYIQKGLRAGKNIYVEKPLCLNEDQLEEIEKAYSAAQPRPALMVGFNRRFSPLTDILKGKVGTGPMSMLYRINAGPISADAWVQDPEIGGGRIIGEVCHFVDYLTYISGSVPAGVFAAAMSSPSGKEDTVTISLWFQNGSIGTISYYANGSKALFKEYIEISRAGTTAVLKDFKRLEIYGREKVFKKKLFAQDKGQKEMLKRFLNAVKNGGEAPVSFDDIKAATLTTFRIMESIKAMTYFGI